MDDDDVLVEDPPTHFLPSPQEDPVVRMHRPPHQILARTAAAVHAELCDDRSGQDRAERARMSHSAYCTRLAIRRRIRQLVFEELGVCLRDRGYEVEPDGVNSSALSKTVSDETDFRECMSTSAATILE